MASVAPSLTIAGLELALAMGAAVPTWYALDLQRPSRLDPRRQAPHGMTMGQVRPQTERITKLADRFCQAVVEGGTARS